MMLALVYLAVLASVPLARGPRRAGRPGRDRLARAHHGAGEFANSQVLAYPKLLFLDDVLATPASWQLHNVFSVGDIVLVVGVAGACPRGVRVAPRPAPARRGRLMFRTALAGTPALAFLLAGLTLLGVISLAIPASARPGPRPASPVAALPATR